MTRPLRVSTRRTMRSAPGSNESIRITRSEDGFIVTGTVWVGPFSEKLVTSTIASLSPLLISTNLDWLVTFAVPPTNQAVPSLSAHVNAAVHFPERL